MNEAPLVPSPPPKEGEDYYLENGLMVFTEEYHRKRGYCCGSACRHCPYGNAPADRKRAEDLTR